MRKRLCLHPWRKVQVLFRLLLVASICTIGVQVVTVVRAQQSAPAMQWEVSALDRRLTSIETVRESEHVDARLRVLESNIGEMKDNFSSLLHMFYTVAAAVIGHFAIAILSLTKRVKS